MVKAASGVAVFLTGIGLDLIGLVGNTDETAPAAVQSAGTLMGLRLLMTVLPMLVLAAALVLFRQNFILTDEKAAQISAQLQETPVSYTHLVASPPQLHTYFPYRSKPSENFMWYWAMHRAIFSL